MRALLINPWVYDFKAFDFWNKPVGLLILAALLKRHGLHIDYIDCMDRLSPYFTTPTKTDNWGRGKYYHEVVSKPPLYKHVPRHYKRYGIPRKIFTEIITEIKPPDIVFITSSMTYWYPGIFEAIRIVRKAFPKVKIILGGIYATLCEDHAKKHSGADIIVPGPVEKKLRFLLEQFDGVYMDNVHVDNIQPDYSFYETLCYAVILTSRGCPFDCTYCATKVLCSTFQVISTDSILEQLDILNTKTQNIAFFDDALLYNKNVPALLKEIIQRAYQLNLHASNGLHCRYITEEIARLMYQANFKTIYLSLETTNPVVQRQTGNKVTTEEFLSAISYLKKVGYTSDALYAYVLYGMPGQEPDEIIDSITLCQKHGVHPRLCEFSPIPHTSEFVKTGFDEHTDPLYHNNLFYTWYYPEAKPGLYKRIKQLLSKKF